jgi:hypothetical protein
MNICNSIAGFIIYIIIPNCTCVCAIGTTILIFAALIMGALVTGYTGLVVCNMYIIHSMFDGPGVDFNPTTSPLLAFGAAIGIAEFLIALFIVNIFLFIIERLKTAHHKKPVTYQED